MNYRWPRPDLREVNYIQYTGQVFYFYTKFNPFEGPSAQFVRVGGPFYVPKEDANRKIMGDQLHTEIFYANLRRLQYIILLCIRLEWLFENFRSTQRHIKS